MSPALVAIELIQDVFQPVRRWAAHQQPTAGFSVNNYLGKTTSFQNHNYHRCRVVVVALSEAVFFAFNGRLPFFSLPRSPFHPLRRKQMQIP